WLRTRLLAPRVCPLWHLDGREPRALRRRTRAGPPFARGGQGHGAGSLPQFRKRDLAAASDPEAEAAVLDRRAVHQGIVRERGQARPLSYGHSPCGRAHGRPAPDLSRRLDGGRAWRPRQGDAGVSHVLRGYLGEGRRRRARAAQSVFEIDRGRGLGLDDGDVLARLSQLPENDREPLAGDVRIAGRQRPGLDRYARGDPKRNRGLSPRRRRLRVRVAAGEFRHDRPRRGRGVDAVVRARGDAALCPRLSGEAVVSPSTVAVNLL